MIKFDATNVKMYKNALKQHCYFICTAFKYFIYGCPYLAKGIDKFNLFDCYEKVLKFLLLSKTKQTNAFL